MIKDKGAKTAPDDANLSQILQNGSDNGVGWNSCAFNKNTLIDYINSKSK